MSDPCEPLVNRAPTPCVHGIMQIIHGVIRSVNPVNPTNLKYSWSITIAEGQLHPMGHGRHRDFIESWDHTPHTPHTLHRWLAATRVHLFAGVRLGPSGPGGACEGL